MNSLDFDNLGRRNTFTCFHETNIAIILDVQYMYAIMLFAHMWVKLSQDKRVEMSQEISLLVSKTLLVCGEHKGW